MGCRKVTSTRACYPDVIQLLYICLESYKDIRSKNDTVFIHVEHLSPVKRKHVLWDF